MLSCLSSEPQLLKQVVSHLDTHSVWALLAAFPSLQRHSVIITDHSFAPMFFGALGLATRRLLRISQVPQHRDEERDTSLHRRHVSQDIPVYDTASDLQPIKLVEVTTYRAHIVLCRQGTGMDRPYRFQEVDLDGTSFVFMSLMATDADAGSSFSMAGDLTRRLDEYTSAKWHFGSRTFFTDVPEEIALETLSSFAAEEDLEFAENELEKPTGEGSVLSEDTLYLAIQTTDILSLETLRIESVFTLPDDLYLPNVWQLSVVFGGEPTTGVRPSIRGLIAPKLRTFAVHFRGVVPLIENCGLVGTDKEAVNVYIKPIRVFELSGIADHTTSLSNTRGPEVDPLDLSFLKNGFKSIILGPYVPLSVIREKDLVLVCFFMLRLASEKDSLPVTLHCPRLFVLYVYVTANDIALPAIKTDYIEMHFHLTCLGRNVSLSRLWACFPSPLLLSCDIHCTTRQGYSSLLSLTKEEWSFAVQPPQILHGLVLTGVKLDFLFTEQSSKDSGSVIEFKTVLETAILTMMSIQPVIDLDAYPEVTAMWLVFDVTTFLQLSGLKRYSFMAPLFFGERRHNPPSFSLNLDASLPSKAVLSQSQFRYDMTVNLSVSPLYDHCCLEGEELDTEPASKWINSMERKTLRKYQSQLVEVEMHRWNIPIFLFCESDTEDNWSKFRKMFDLIYYNPYIRFPEDDMTYTLLHSNRPGEPDAWDRIDEVLVL